MNSRPEQRAELARQMLILSTEREPEPKRSAMRKLIRAFGDARYEAGRERESRIHQQDEMNRDVERLQREFSSRRRHEVDA